MLNYVWFALIVLGLAAGLSSDFNDRLADKYKNGKPIKTEIIGNSSYKPNATSEIELKINRMDFEKFYSEKTSNDIILKGKVTFKEDANKGSLYLLTNDETPAIIKKIASINGKENDLLGKIEIKKTGTDSTLSGFVYFEEISFVKMKEITGAAIGFAETAVTIALGLIGIMAMWLGIMKIAEEAGIINFLARMLRPITRFLYPDVPPDNPAIGAMIMNFSANFLGLGNAATPFGLKAMDELEKINPNKGVASNAMCTFLTINTAGMTLIPATAIAVRASAGSSEPAIIIGTSIFGSFCATVVGVTVAKIFENFPVKAGALPSLLKAKRKPLSIIAGVIAFVLIGVLTGLFSLIGKNVPLPSTETVKTVIQVVSTLAIPVLIIVFVGYGFIKKVKVYETFVEGAKEGFNIAIRIIPYLVAMLVAIAIFRAGGAMEWLIYSLSYLTNPIGMPAEALPMALMRPLSGSGSLGVMAEIMSVHGPDSFIGILVSTFFGSSETTFYVLAVYFGSVNVKKTRHALPAGLIADTAGFLGALFIVKMLFG
ncbi:MAG: spore maturation protein [Ignavibacteriaceae bacterium]|nr:spore maturation protein [Ignavibacteriaceae bacterium]